MVSDLRRLRVLIATLRGWPPGALWRKDGCPHGDAGRAQRAVALASRSTRMVLGLLVIGRLNALGYAGLQAQESQSFTGGSGSLRHFGGGDHVLRKIITWAIVIFLLYYLATNPGGAAHALHNALNGLKSAGNSMSQFVSKL
jgi:hypothetical protein